MNEKTLQKLEFDKVKEMVMKKAVTEEAKKRLQKLQPSIEIKKVQQLQKETADAIAVSIKKGRLPVLPIKDICPILKRVEIGAILSSVEILEIARLLKATRQIKQYAKEDTGTALKTRALDGYFDALESNQILEREIHRCILGPDQFADDATDQLLQLRKQSKRLTGKIRETLQQVLSSHHYQDMLQEAIITIRRDRYCVPIKVEYKNQFKGIVHDQSSTGATVFIEPLAVVELNNQLKTIEMQEQEEIEKLLIRFTEQIVPLSGMLKQNFETLICLDVIFAKAEFSLQYDCRMPKLNTKGYIHLKKARHPLLPKESVVPIELMLGKEFTTLLITGPNTGGKTVALKTVGLFVIMVQSGLQIPAAEDSEMAVFDDIFAALGDEQSIEQNLSTFSAHMTTLIKILEKMTLNSLILMDEIGSGTDPIEGAALAKAILEHLRKQQIRTIATTHYSELKLYALTQEGVENASCEFDIESLRPTYRLLLGVPGKSNAFAISSKLGLAAYLIEDAKSYLQKENIKMEDLLVDLESNKIMAEKEREKASSFRKEAEKLREEMQKDRKKLQTAKKKVLQRAEEKAAEMIKQTKEEADVLLKEVRQAARKAQAAIDEKLLYETKQNMTNTLEKRSKHIQKVAGVKEKVKKVPKSVSVGQEVMVTTLKQKGIVIESADNKQNVTVRIGILPMKVKLTDLALVDDTQSIVTEKKVKQSKMPKTTYRIAKTANISTEMDVRGLMVDEATPVVDKYLDDAYLAGLKNVTIIHGKGTGALRAGITKMLKRHPHVSAHRPGMYGEGEMGVTVVTLK